MLTDSNSGWPKGQRKTLFIDDSAMDTNSPLAGDEWTEVNIDWRFFRRLLNPPLHRTLKTFLLVAVIVTTITNNIKSTAQQELQECLCKLFYSAQAVTRVLVVSARLSSE